MRARRGRALPLPAATGRSRPPSGPPPSSAPGPAVRQRSEAAAAPAGSPPRRAATLIPAAAGPAPPRPALPAPPWAAPRSPPARAAGPPAALSSTSPPPAARPVPSRPAAPRCGRLSRDAGTGSSEGPRRRRCSARRREARPGAAGRDGSRASLLRSRGLPRRDGPQPLRAFLLVLGGNSTASGGLSQQTLLGAGRNR